jgi:hypothetical protein
MQHFQGARERVSDVFFRRSKRGWGMVRSSWVVFSWHFLEFGLSWVSLHFLESVFSAGFIPFIYVVLNNGMGL